MHNQTHNDKRDYYEKVSQKPGYISYDDVKKKKCSNFSKVRNKWN
jgi:hypothetical protein